MKMITDSLFLQPVEYEGSKQIKTTIFCSYQQSLQKIHSQQFRYWHEEETQLSHIVILISQNIPRYFKLKQF